MYKQTRKKHDVLIPTSEVAGIYVYAEETIEFLEIK
jgi:hypothetical protein